MTINQTLRERLNQTSRFLLGIELVSVRGLMTEGSAVKVCTLAKQLAEASDIDWISITDNAGGNPQTAPQALGKLILNTGKEVVINLSCKDRNRNGLESDIWMLNSDGFHNVLAITGDYPADGDGGAAKPVFDFDSIGLISMLSKMNLGFGLGYEKTDFFIGAVITNYKLLEGEVVPQYLKLKKKIECGARFIINQVGYDSRKAHELCLYMDQHGMRHIPLIGNVYLLSPKVAQTFHSGKIPGIVVTRPLLDICLRYGQGADRGKAFFCEFAAKQMAVYRGLGFRGSYIGGVHDFSVVKKILDIERTFTPDDWKEFAREIQFSRPEEFFYYDKDPATGLADPKKRGSTAKRKSGHAGFTYRLSKLFHGMVFTPDRTLSKWGAKVCRNSADSLQGPKPLRVVERLSKTMLYNCKDCGDCSLPEISFLCPESQCAKNQRNGPCGGTREGRCEVNGFGDCIWLRAYNRMKTDGREEQLLNHAPVIQNQALRGTSAWANNWLGRDHAASPSDSPVINNTKPPTEEKNV
jgi:methylenetetrahydrofolate reductase (NADPH)